MYKNAIIYLNMTIPVYVDYKNGIGNYIFYKRMEFGTLICYGRCSKRIIIYEM